jgi:hypothetical protein
MLPGSRRRGAHDGGAPGRGASRLSAVRVLGSELWSLLFLVHRWSLIPLVGQVDLPISGDGSGTNPTDTGSRGHEFFTEPRVKSGKGHSEHMISGLGPITDLRRQGGLDGKKGESLRELSRFGSCSPCATGKSGYTLSRTPWRSFEGSDYYPRTKLQRDHRVWSDYPGWRLSEATGQQNEPPARRRLSSTFTY